MPAISLPSSTSVHTLAPTFPHLPPPHPLSHTPHYTFGPRPRHSPPPPTHSCFMMKADPASSFSIACGQRRHATPLHLLVGYLPLATVPAGARHATSPHSACHHHSLLPPCLPIPAFSCARFWRGTHTCYARATCPTPRGHTSLPACLLLPPGSCPCSAAIAPAIAFLHGGCTARRHWRHIHLATYSVCRRMRACKMP